MFKVLWFTNTPALAEEKLSNKPVGGGWIKSLDLEMQTKVNLHVAFYHQENILPFKYKNTHYYPIHDKGKTLLRKYIDAKLSKIKLNEDISVYLDLINEIKPDLIHIHGTENPFGYIIEKTKIPVVISIQGNINVYYHKYTSGLGKKHLNTSQSIINKIIGIFF